MRSIAYFTTLIFLALISYSCDGDDAPENPNNPEMGYFVHKMIHYYYGSNQTIVDTIYFSYDDQNRIIRERLIKDNQTSNSIVTVDFEYNTNGLLNSLKHVEGSQMNDYHEFQYDASGYLNKIISYFNYEQSNETIVERTIFYNNDIYTEYVNNTEISIEIDHDQLLQLKESEFVYGSGKGIHQYAMPTQPGRYFIQYLGLNYFALPFSNHHEVIKETISGSSWIFTNTRDDQGNIVKVDYLFDEPNAQPLDSWEIEYEQRELN